MSAQGFHTHLFFQSLWGETTSQLTGPMFLERLHIKNMPKAPMDELLSEHRHWDAASIGRYAGRHEKALKHWRWKKERSEKGYETPALPYLAWVAGLQFEVQCGSCGSDRAYCGPRNDLGCSTYTAPKHNDIHSKVLEQFKK